MKLIALIIPFALAGCTTTDRSFPQQLPEPLGEMTLITIAHAWELGADDGYPRLTKDDLDEIDFGYRLDEGRVPANVQLIKLLNSSFGEPEAIAMCFDPRHAIVYESKYGRVEAHVCFACASTSVLINEWDRTFYHVHNVELEVNQIFEEAGVRVPVSGR